MAAPQATGDEVERLASHLLRRRPEILEAWQAAVARDPELTTPSSLPRTQFYDHIPDILDDLARRLTALPAPANSDTAEERTDAAAHGMQRWQQGYDLREVIREWGHLQLCLAAELESYLAEYPEAPRDVMAAARRALAELCNRGVAESTAKYFQLREQEAEGNARDLEHALEHARSLEQRHAQLWQEAAHDLRGNLGVVANASALLSMENLSAPLREKFFRLLQQNVSSLHAMLTDVTNLARLQAGHEWLDTAPFDAAGVLRELCASLESEASARGLYLRTDGAASLNVDGDAVKVRRIAQNLLLNALKYTQRGGVVVRWGDSRKNDPARWMFSVEDTGPGFHAGPGAPLAGALEEATEEARQVEQRARRGPDASAVETGRLDEPAFDSRPVRQERGEGIGLSIVKRLCELLDAGLEMESEPGTGTVVRVLLPREYPPRPKDRSPK